MKKNIVRRKNDNEVITHDNLIIVAKEYLMGKISIEIFKNEEK